MELEAKFVKEAKEAGLVSLKGHRSVGGMRASIYNAMPIDMPAAYCKESLHPHGFYTLASLGFQEEPGKPERAPFGGRHAGEYL